MHGKQKKGERSMERKTMGTQAGVLITILGERSGGYRGPADSICLSIRA